MATSIVEISQQLFRAEHRRASDYPRVTTCFDRKYLKIPIDKECFDVPLFAIDAFHDLVTCGRDSRTDFIVAKLYTEGREPRYTTLSNFMPLVLLSEFKREHLIKLPVRQKDDTIYYYGTNGAVFDADFNIIMLVSWRIARTVNINGDPAYKFLNPVIYVNPRCVEEPDDPMKRYIMKKIVPTFSSLDTLAPSYFYRDSPKFIMDDDSWYGYEVKIEMCKSTFKSKVAHLPSFSTSNEKLCQLALEHINEIVPY